MALDAACQKSLFKTDRREQVIIETILTERSYVKNLGELCVLKSILLEQRLLADCVIQKPFSTIDLIYELHQRFCADLDGIEGVDSWGVKLQKYSSLFVRYENDFNVYLPYIANLSMFDRVSFVRGIFPMIEATGHSITRDFFSFDGYLLSPYSRFAKYPILMKVRLGAKLEVFQFFPSTANPCDCLEHDSLHYGIGRDQALATRRRGRRENVRAGAGDNRVRPTSGGNGEVA